jgi:hypothetical protein
LDYGLRGSEWQAYYDELISKCEAAGVQKVLDEIQGQIDAFLQG